MGGFDYPNEFYFDIESVPGAAIAGFLGAFYIGYFIFLLAVYVIQSIGLYTLANRRGIRHSWLAWVPVGSAWILGSISDQYQYVAKGKVRNRRKFLLVLELGMVGILVGLLIAAVIIIALSDAFFGGMLLAVLLIILGYLAIIALAITTTVYTYICLYDLYRSCNPENGVLFLVLSIVFSMTMPFFVFACRKKDLGMPPRKQPAPQQVVEVVQEEPVAEPVEEGYALPEEFEE